MRAAASVAVNPAHGEQGVAAVVASAQLTRPMFDSGAHRAAETAMRRIIQANIDRLKELLKTELDPTRRAMESKLLAEEEVKLTQEPKDGKKKAF